MREAAISDQMSVHKAVDLLVFFSELEREAYQSHSLANEEYE